MTYDAFRIILKTCSVCHKYYKRGIWDYLTPDEAQDIEQEKRRISYHHVICTGCKEEGNKL